MNDFLIYVVSALVLTIPVPKSESKWVNFEQNLPEFFYWHLSCGVCSRLLNSKPNSSGTNIYIFILISVVSSTVITNESTKQYII